jgi:hypothetical protein
LEKARTQAGRSPHAVLDARRRLLDVGEFQHVFFTHGTESRRALGCSGLAAISLLP